MTTLNFVLSTKQQSYSTIQLTESEMVALLNDLSMLKHDIAAALFRFINVGLLQLSITPQSKELMKACLNA